MTIARDRVNARGKTIKKKDRFKESLTCRFTYPSDCLKVVSSSWMGLFFEGITDGLLFSSIFCNASKPTVRMCRERYQFNVTEIHAAIYTYTIDCTSQSVGSE